MLLLGRARLMDKQKMKYGSVFTAFFDKDPRNTMMDGRLGVKVYERPASSYHILDHAARILLQLSDSYGPLNDAH